MNKIGTLLETCKRFGVPTETIPEHVWDVPVFRNARLRTCFGKAVATHPQHGRHIQIHKCVFVDPDQMRETLAHEVAHIIAGINAGHDWTWKSIARGLGHSGERCATIEAAERIGITRKEQAVRIVARCSKCDHEIIRARALPRKRIYGHRGCGGRFERVD